MTTNAPCSSGTSSRHVRFQGSAGALIGDCFPTANEPRNTVLYLHGAGQRRFSWNRTAARLAKSGWRGINYDARGHGESDWVADGDYSIDGFIDDLAAVVAQIGERPVVVGASLGGMTALIAEAERQDLLRALVLVDVVARMEPAGIKRIHEFMAAHTAGFRSLEDAAEAVAAFNPNRRRPASSEGLRKNLTLTDRGRWVWHWDPASLPRADNPLRGASQQRAEQAARDIAVPTLVVWGGKSEVVESAAVEEMLTLIPGARAARVDGGHMIAGDDNDVFGHQLEEFLMSIEAGIR